jgi:anti-anti-sigma factor
MTVHQPQDERVFNWSESGSGDVLTIRLAGELDLAGVPEFGPQLESQLERRFSTVVLDLSELIFADSTALRLLIDLKRTANMMQKHLVLRDVSTPVLRLFEAGGLTKWFDYLEGHGPSYGVCPVCSGDVLTGTPRCINCGGAL